MMDSDHLGEWVPRMIIVGDWGFDNLCRSWLCSMIILVHYRVRSTSPWDAEMLLTLQQLPTFIKLLRYLRCVLMWLQRIRVILPHFSHDHSALQDFHYKYFSLLLLGSVPKQVYLSNTKQNRQSVTLVFIAKLSSLTNACQASQHFLDYMCGKASFSLICNNNYCKSDWLKKNFNMQKEFVQYSVIIN